MNYCYALVLVCATTLSASDDGLHSIPTTPPAAPKDQKQFVFPLEKGALTKYSRNAKDPQKKPCFAYSDNTKKPQNLLFEHFQKNTTTYGIAAGTTLAVVALAVWYGCKKSAPQQPFCYELQA